MRSNILEVHLHHPQPHDSIDMAHLLHELDKATDAVCALGDMIEGHAHQREKVHDNRAPHGHGNNRVDDSLARGHVLGFQLFRREPRGVQSPAQFGGAVESLSHKCVELGLHEE